MKATQLTTDNLETYRDQIDPDDAENIGREYYSGIAVENGQGKMEAGAIWEIRVMETLGNDIISEISWINASNDDAGSALFDEYDDIVLRDQVSLSCFEIPEDEGEKAEELLVSKGFDTKEREGRMITFTVSDLKKLEVLKLNKKVPSYVHPLSDISEWDFKRGLIGCIFQSHRTLIQDLCSLPIEWYDPDLSCYIESDGRAEGFLLVHKTASGKLRIELFINAGPDPKELFHMARFAVKKAIEIYDDDTQIVVIRRDKEILKLTGYLFPSAKGSKAYTGRRKEQS
jgi:hypothetical protein